MKKNDRIVTLKAWCAVSLLAASLPAMAVEKKNTPPGIEASSHARDEIEHVLVSVPIHRTEAETALPITALSGDELRNAVANTIGETLSSKPGLSSASFGPSVGQPVIRGQQGARVAVLQNSTSSADASNVSADHAVSVEPILAESIEVLRGPATLLYGNGAIGGVVNIIDKRVPVSVAEDVELAAEVRHASVNDETTSVFSLDAGQGSVAIHLDGLSRSSNNVEIPGTAVNPLIEEDHGDEEPMESEAGFIDNTDNQVRSFTAGASYIFEDGFIGFAVSQLDNEYGIPPGSHAHEDEHEEEGAHADEAELVRIDSRQQRYDVRADIHNPIAGIDNVRWFLSYTDYQHDELEGGEVGTRWSNESWENRIEAVHSTLAGFHGVVGLQVKQSTFSAVGDESFIPETDLTNAGIFIVEDFHRDNWIYELGARVDINELKPVSSIDDKQFTNLSLSSSALWQVSDRWSLGVALSKSERAPVIEELYSNVGSEEGTYIEHVASGSIELGDINLSREQANNLDLTARYENGVFEGYVTIFYNDFRDYIFLANTGVYQDETPVLQYAQQDAVFKGAEFEFSLDAGSPGGGALTIDLFGDYLDGELDTAGDIPRLPPQRLGVRLAYERDWLAGYLSVLDAAEQNRPGLNEEETDGYTRWDAGLSATLSSAKGGEWLAFLRLKNITDEEIRNSTSFLRDIAPEAGRSIEAGVRFSL